MACFHTCSALDLRAPPRDTVPFDYAWRFQLKTTHMPPPPTPPPTPPGTKPDCSTFNTTRGSTCSGLKATALGNASAAACKAACCSEVGCTVYQFQAVGTNPTSNCWTGTCSTPFRGVNPTWNSGAVPTAPPVPPVPPPAPPPPQPYPKICGAACGVGYDDSAWTLVDAPHDYIVTLPIPNSNVSQTSCCGFFPRADAVYVDA